jgi:hypothetical protein
MIYLVTGKQELFDWDEYRIISVEESLFMMKDWSVVQLDSETTGRDAHLCDFLCVQMGNDKADARIVVDCTTINIRLYKDVLESKLCILQNGKFDLQFFYNYGIIIRKVYDTMIVEQLLHLGWPSGQISYALNAITDRRLHINIDKTVRGEIIWRGLDTKVINYAALTYWGRIVSDYYLEKWMNCWNAKGVFLCQSAAKPVVHRRKVHRLPEEYSLLNNRTPKHLKNSFRLS